MTSNELTTEDIAVIRGCLGAFPEIEEAVLYGSRALGTARPGSDVDIAIKGRRVTEDTRVRLHLELEEETALPYFFDVTDYNTIANPELKEHIDSHGRIMYRKSAANSVPAGT